MTVLSCAFIGLAFLIAVVLLLVAGVALGWLVPALVARWKAGKKQGA